VLRLFAGREIDDVSGNLPEQRAELLGALDRAMRQVSARSVLFSHAVAERSGVNSTDMECLDLLILMGPMPAGQLAELTGLTTGAITGVIDRLERAGYARRENDPNDRRRVIVQPVREKAEGEIGRFYTSLTHAMAELYACYSDEELALVVDFATRADAIVQEATRRLRKETPAVRKRRQSQAPGPPGR
jgi:DNA-binding MarR family transcriptional regulator